MRMTALVALTALSAVAVAGAQTRVVDFTQDTADQPPKGFEFGHTAKVGAPGRWLVQAEGSNKLFAQRRTYGKPSKVPAGQWGTLRVVARGPRFAVYHNGSKLYEVEDATFAQAGKVASGPRRIR